MPLPQHTESIPAHWGTVLCCTQATGHLRAVCQECLHLIRGHTQAQVAPQRLVGLLFLVVGVYQQHLVPEVDVPIY